MSNFSGITDFGIPVLPSGMYFDRVLWVSSVFGGADNDGRDKARPLATVFGPKGAWAKAASGAAGKDTAHGTLVIAMKGHAETVAGADHGADLGTKQRIYTVGQGEGVESPTLTWSVAGSTLLLDTQNVILDNFNLLLEPGTGGVNVAAPITISGQGSGLRRCLVRAGTDASNKVTVGITITGDEVVFDRVFLYSAVAAEATTFIRLTGADRLRMYDCYIHGATSAVGVGVMQLLTTASTFLDVQRCRFANHKAASTDAVTGLAGSSGWVTDSYFGTLVATGAGTLDGWTTKANVQFGGCQTINAAGEGGAPTTPVSAV